MLLQSIFLEKTIKKWKWKFRRVIMPILIFLAICLIVMLNRFYKVFKGRRSKKFSKNIVKRRQIISENEKNSKYYDILFKLLPVKYSQVQIDELEAELAWVGSSMSPKQYILKPYILFILSILLGLFLAYVSKGIKVISFSMISVGLIIGFVNFKKNAIELKNKQKEKRKRIILEMPRLVKTIQFSPKTKSLDNIIEDYLKQAKSGLKQDLQLLLADIRAGIDENRALKRFSNRINIQEVSELVSVLQLTGLNSADSKVSLQFLGTKFREKTFRIIEKELSRRPEKLSVLNDLLLNMLVLLILVPVAIQAFTGITNIMK